MSSDDTVNSLNHSVTYLEPLPHPFLAPHMATIDIPHIVHRPPPFWRSSGLPGYRQLHISAHCGHSVQDRSVPPNGPSVLQRTADHLHDVVPGVWWEQDVVPGSVRMISVRSVQAPLVVSPIPPSARKSESLKSKHPRLEFESKVSKSIACGVGVRFVCWFGTECD